jgi:RNase P subunit RPR2
MIHPKLHLICGRCGCNNMLTYSIGTDIDDETEKEYQYVNIICNNCHTITQLDEFIKEEKEDNK